MYALYEAEDLGEALPPDLRAKEDALSLGPPAATRAFRAEIERQRKSHVGRKIEIGGPEE